MTSDKTFKHNLSFFTSTGFMLGATNLLLTEREGTALAS